MLGFEPANAQWAELGGLNALSANNSISAICTDAAGNIYAAGGFKNSSSKYYVAKWNGTSWTELGGLNALSANSNIIAICTDAAGNIYAAGNFTNSSAKRYVAKWNGTSWSEVGGLNGLSASSSISAICTDAAGNIYAAGYFTNGSGKRYVAKWDGTSWTELGGLNALSANSNIIAICTDAAGNIYAAGFFRNSSSKYYVAKWDGTSWTELGGLNGLSANSSISAICTDAAGNIYAAGLFLNSSAKYYVAKWNGTSWTELGGLNGLAANGQIRTLCTDAAGNIYAAGNFTNSSSKCYVAKWNGTSWSELGGLNGLSANSIINAICTDALGIVYAAGAFTNSSGKYYVARCALSSGQNITICPNALPYVWNGKTFTATHLTDTLKRISYLGFDSLVYLTVNLTFKKSTSTTSLCYSQLPYSYLGHNITKAGYDTLHLTASNGCDSFAILYTTYKVNPSYPIISANAPTTNCTGSSVVLSTSLIDNTPNYSNSMQFNGTNAYVSIPNVNYTGTNSFTIEAWIKPTDISTNTYYEIARQQTGTTTQNFLLSFQNNGTILSFGLATVNQAGYSELDVPITASNFTDGNWHHVAAVYDGATRKMYVDGILVGTDNKTGSVYFGTPANTNIGSNFPYNEYFKGNLDEVRFWNIARTQTQIQNAMNSPLPNNTVGLTAYYEFNDTTGTIAADSSGNGNNGTMVNATRTVNTPVAYSSITWSPSGATTSSITASSTGLYSVQVTNALGCAVSFSVNVHIGLPTSSNVALNICSSVLPYTWQGKIFTATHLTDTLKRTNYLGCDSIVNLSVMVNPVSTSTIDSTICSSQLPFVWNGITCNTAGTFYDTLAGGNYMGCDSIIIMHLHVKQSTSSTTPLTVCASQMPYYWNGTSIPFAGNLAVPNLVNAAGCDSTANLVLTVANSTQSTASQTICSSQLPYSHLGHTMNAAGNDTLHLTNAAGCDSMAILSLIVNPLITPTVSLAAPSTNNNCTNTPITFSASSVNAGTNPIYEWYVNGTSVGFHTSPYTRAIYTNNSIVKVKVYPQVACTATAISNSDTIAVLPKLTPYFLITRNANNVCAGTPITYSALTVTNGGTSPSYQWMVNSTMVGTNSPSYTTSTLNNLDTVKCIMTSSYGCLSKPSSTSNQFVATINPKVTPSVSLAAPSSSNVCASSPVTFSASSVNAGTNPIYEWYVNGTSVGFHTSPYTRAIYTNNSIVKVKVYPQVACQVTSLSNSDTVLTHSCTIIRLKSPNNTNDNIETTAGIELYPNPALNNVAIRYQLLEDDADRVTILLMDIAGKTIQSQMIDHPEMTGVVHFDLKELQSGVYLVNVKTTNYSETKRLIVNK